METYSSQPLKLSESDTLLLHRVCAKKNYKSRRVHLPLLTMQSEFSSCALENPPPPPQVKPQIVLAKACLGNLRKLLGRFKGIYGNSWGTSREFK